MEAKMAHILKKSAFLFTAILLLFVGVIFSSDVIQTQESDSWEGIEVDLTSLNIKNNIITVKLKFRNVGSERQRGDIAFGDCYIMDEVNQKKYYPLKDSDGIYIGGPLSTKIGGGKFNFELYPEKTKSLWIKFPEPTDNPETITLSLPGVFPFEEIELKK